MTRAYQVPHFDLAQACADSKGMFCIRSGEFVELYSDSEEKFDVVVTCFFIDTSHFVLDYIETINFVLKGYFLFFLTINDIMRYSKIIR